MSRESAEPRTTSRNAAACAASHLDAEAEAPAAGGAEEELERRARKAAGQARARFVATTGSASYELLAYESQRDANIAALQAFLGVLGLSDSGVAPAGASAPPRVPREPPATLTCPTCGRTIKLEDNCHDPARVRGMVGRRSSELTMQVTMRVGYHSASWSPAASQCTPRKRPHGQRCSLFLMCRRDFAGELAVWCGLRTPLPRSHEQQSSSRPSKMATRRRCSDWSSAGSRA
jgi:hypothetical protein